ELDAINCRIFDIWGVIFQIAERDTVGATLKLATYTEAEGAPADADPIVTELQRTLTREGDYADGVLAKFDWTNAAGTRVVQYQLTGGGANDKGSVKTYTRPRPAANAAEKLLTRTLIR